MILNQILLKLLVLITRFKRISYEIQLSDLYPDNFYLFKYWM
jgi:hypothetical protein